MRHLWPLISSLSLALSVGLCAQGDNPSPPTSPSATRGEPVIYTVNMRKVFENHPKVIEWQRKANEQRSGRQSTSNQADERSESYKKLLNQITSINDELAAGRIKAEDVEETKKRRDVLLPELQAMEREIQEFQLQREKNLQAESAQKRAEIVDEITKAIAAAPEIRDADLIFDSSGPTLLGVPFTTNSNPAFDRTDAVLRQLGVKTPAPAPATTKNDEDPHAPKPPAR